MGEHAGFWLPAVLLAVLLAALRSAHAEDGYFVDGGKLVLRPFVSVPITNVLWKHNGNLVAKWVEDVVPLTYYGAFTFNKRTTLGITTGRLEIKNMSRADAGTYTLNINNVVRKRRFDVKAIKEVPQPVVLLRPRGCTRTHSCTMVCSGNTAGAGPVTYAWKGGDGVWKELGRERDIPKNKTAHVETFSCRMKNPVSQKESKPYKNPFFQRTPPDSGRTSTRVLKAVCKAVAFLALSGPAVYLVRRYRERLRTLICPHQSGGRADDNSA